MNLPNRKSFSPDAAFYVGPPPGPGFLEGAPIFAVEVRSEIDYGEGPEREMAAKRRDYFAAGTLVVWDVDVLKSETVRVYRASDPDKPTIYRRGKKPRPSLRYPAGPCRLTISLADEQSKLEGSKSRGVGAVNSCTVGEHVVRGPVVRNVRTPTMEESDAR